MEPKEPYMKDGKWRCGFCNARIYTPRTKELDRIMKDYILYCRHCGTPVAWKKE